MNLRLGWLNNKHKNNSMTSGNILSRKFLIPAYLIAAGLFLMLLAVSINGFANFYAAHIFTKISLPYCALTGMLPFSVGELMLYLAAVLLLVLLLAGCIFIIKGIIFKRRSVPKWFKVYAWIIWYLIGIFSLIMMLNCFILYRTSDMDVSCVESNASGSKLLGDEDMFEAFALDNDINYENISDYELLCLVRDYVVERCNELSKEFERNEQGYIIGYRRENDGSVINSDAINGNAININSIISNHDFGTPSKEYEKVLAKESKRAMNDLSKSGLKRLAGYYPKPKYLLYSLFFSQQHMMGYYFPFSMESNINEMMYITNYPFTICHELSHLKGYIKEDEANFLAYLACIGSDDLMFKYSGYLGVLNYLDNEFYKQTGRNAAEYLSHTKICEEVKKDDIFLTDKAWDLVEKEKVVDTETVHKASNAFTESVLTSNGIKDGMGSYNRVVQLLLMYYKK